MNKKDLTTGTPSDVHLAAEFRLVIGRYSMPVPHFQWEIAQIYSVSIQSQSHCDSPVQVFLNSVPCLEVCLPFFVPFNLTHLYSVLSSVAFVFPHHACIANNLTFSRNHRDHLSSFFPDELDRSRSARLWISPASHPPSSGSGTQSRASTAHLLPSSRTGA